jgi:hypothetical protein
VNESGASSNEISDIDVRLEDELIVSAEVKDKTYKMHDVEHALQKVSRAGFHTLHFIGGPRARLSGDDENLKQFAYDCGVELYMIDLSSLIANTVAFAPSSLRLEAVAERVLAYAAEARVKTETMRWITESLRAIHRDG